MEEITYPIRINRYLYLKGFCSRRKADQLIEKGDILINGEVATLGAKVLLGDEVTVGKHVRKLQSEYKYFLYHKPRGIVSHNPQGDEKSVEDVSGLGKSFFPVGRLDKASHGLMLLTNDGRIVNRLLSPEFEHEREYVVRVDKKITNTFITRMKKGVNIEGYTTKPSIVRKVNDLTFNITLTEGKKHQIRRMTVALGYQVKDLKRIRIMDLTLSAIEEGKTKEFSNEEKTSLLKSLTVPTDA
ncbi:rRNA pseudouridine synthase [Candidatus Kaiserbacteria bacterium]|nr:rRNA pseudouridine synthase [Candidatus Kaiserbacteria bacterium]